MLVLQDNLPLPAVSPFIMDPNAVSGYFTCFLAAVCLALVRLQSCHRPTNRQLTIHFSTGKLGLRFPQMPHTWRSRSRRTFHSIRGSLSRSPCLSAVGHRSQGLRRHGSCLYVDALPGHDPSQAVSLASLGIVSRAPHGQDHKSVADVHLVHRKTIPYPRRPPRPLRSISPDW